MLAGTESVKWLADTSRCGAKIIIQQLTWLCTAVTPAVMKVFRTVVVRTEFSCTRLRVKMKVCQYLKLLTVQNQSVKEVIMKQMVMF